MKKTANPAKSCVQKILRSQKILRTRNCRRKFIKNLLPEKRKENMYKSRFKSRLNKNYWFHQNKFLYSTKYFIPLSK